MNKDDTAGRLAKYYQKMKLPGFIENPGKMTVNYRKNNWDTVRKMKKGLVLAMSLAGGAGYPNVSNPNATVNPKSILKNGKKKRKRSMSRGKVLKIAKAKTQMREWQPEKTQMDGEW